MSVRACVIDLGSPWDTREDSACGNDRSAVTDTRQQMRERNEAEEEEL